MKRTGFKSWNSNKGYRSQDRFSPFMSPPIMKWGLWMVVVLVMNTALSVLNAQESDSYNAGSDEMITLVKGRHVGAYGAFTVKYFNMDNRDGMMFGGRTGLVIGHGFSFGITGTGFSTQPKYDSKIGYDAMVTGGYGGFYFEPILFPRYPVHVAFPVTMGAGGISYKTYITQSGNWDEYSSNYSHGNGYLLFEPAVELEFNVMRHFRFAIHASYIMTSNIDLRYNTGNNAQIIGYDALNGLTAGATFKLGWF